MWNKFCYLQDFRNDRLKLWWNDQFFEKSTYDIDKIRGGGLFYLGQDQDDYGGGFNEDQSMNVVVADLRLYDRLLSEEEAKSFVKCEDKISFTPLMDFSNVERDWILNGSVEVQTISTDVICSNKSSFQLMFPEPRLFREAFKLCNITEGKLVVPTNQQENNELIPLVNGYIDLCMEASNWMAWLGVMANKTTGKYYNIYTREEIKYHNLVSTNYLAHHDCVPFLTGVGKEGMWGRGRCDRDPVCSICEYKTVSQIKVSALFLSILS